MNIQKQFIILNLMAIEREWAGWLCCSNAEKSVNKTAAAAHRATHIKSDGICQLREVSCMCLFIALDTIALARKATIKWIGKEMTLI